MASLRKRQATRAKNRRRAAVLHRLKVAGGIGAAAMVTAGLVYMIHRHTAVHRPAAAHPAPVAAAPAPPATVKTNAPAEPPAPRFDFYTMLPKLKVIVPKTEGGSAAPPPTSTAAQADDAPGVYALQVGSFRALSDADRVKAQLALLGVEADIYTVRVDNDTWHRLMVGPFNSLHQLNHVAVRLQRNNVDYIVMKVKG